MKNGIKGFFEFVTPVSLEAALERKAVVEVELQRMQVLLEKNQLGMLEEARDFNWETSTKSCMGFAQIELAKLTEWMELTTKKATFARVQELEAESDAKDVTIRELRQQVAKLNNPTKRWAEIQSEKNALEDQIADLQAVVSRQRDLIRADASAPEPKHVNGVSVKTLSDNLISCKAANDKLKAENAALRASLEELKHVEPGLAGRVSQLQNELKQARGGDSRDHLKQQNNYFRAGIEHAKYLLAGNKLRSAYEHLNAVGGLRLVDTPPTERLFRALPDDLYPWLFDMVVS